MAVEFSGLTFDCDRSRQVPRGSSYEGLPVSCATLGAKPGQRFVDGGQYLSSYYGFTHAHIWRNLGILLGMSLAYILLTMCFLENFDWSNGARGAGGVEHVAKRSRRGTEIKDTENQVKEGPFLNTDVSKERDASTAIAAADSIFAWEDITYTISHGKSVKSLLQSVSGYCKPGEMTALVGASGAGKSTRKYSSIRAVSI
jgi:ABC-type multidrug transport system fused ATPase/permease subunit